MKRAYEQERLSEEQGCMTRELVAYFHGPKPGETPMSPEQQRIFVQKRLEQMRRFKFAHVDVNR